MYHLNPKDLLFLLLLTVFYLNDSVSQGVAGVHFFVLVFMFSDFQPLWAHLQ